MVSVEGILKKAFDKEQKAQQLVTVDNKQIDLTYDLAHLAAFDSNPLDLQVLKSDKRESYIHTLTRDNTQLIINKIWNLETKRVDNVIMAVLPSQVIYNLPRAKPIPKPKLPTKWELFSRSKGIVKKKKERMVWDEVSQQWKPRFGYRSIGQQKQENQWLIEVPNQVDPNTDLFAKDSEERSERIAKNELQRLRNLPRSQKDRLPGTSGILPNIDLKKDELAKAKSLVKKSTASLGKFFNVDSKDSSQASNKVVGEKRKFESNFQKDLSEEKLRNLKLAEKVLAEQKCSVDNDLVEQQASKMLKKINSRFKKISNQRNGKNKNDDKILQQSRGNKKSKMSKTATNRNKRHSSSSSHKKAKSTKKLRASQRK